MALPFNQITLDNLARWDVRTRITGNLILAKRSARDSIKQLLLRQEKLRRGYMFSLSVCTLLTFMMLWSGIALVAKAATVSFLESTFKLLLFIALAAVLIRSITTAQKFKALYRDTEYIRRNAIAHKLPGWWELFRQGLWRRRMAAPDTNEAPKKR